MLWAQTINCLEHILRYYTEGGCKKQKLQEVWTVMSMNAARKHLNLICKPQSTSLMKELPSLFNSETMDTRKSIDRVLFLLVLY